ncbi:hypothetical protein G7Z17_g7013 [Cylindrodendrum hubeiense]|uniref:DUF7029 domain-containing protein n=1 Tax=Cylindrodendrum hubeiense TaxID=595255 RepID=A0A9P5H8R9_9HYPO|nr:hypothetical protein G7Z17_g7013 [Cylindrodendrum hubeiense]
MVMLSSAVYLAIMAGLVSGRSNPSQRSHALFAKSLNNSRVGHESTLSPIVNPDIDTSDIKNLVPCKNVSLAWGAQGNGLVNVSLEMSHPTVVLEDIDDITSVDCESGSVSVTFANKAAFDEALEDWSDDDRFVLVTNHLGDCDAENERGIFLAQSITSDNDTFTVVASGEKSDLSNTAAFTEITFSAIPAGESKRAITINTDGLTVSNTLALTPATSLYSYAPYLYVTADEANLTTSVTLSGKLRYSILLAKVYELSFDVDTYASADLGLTIDVTAPYSQDVVYDPAPLTYSIVNVPGIVTLGPALDFAIGVNVSADAAVSLTTDLGLKIEDGNFHLDFLDSSSSSATGWTPVFSAHANISEKAAASVDPYVDITVMLQFELLGGLLDLSGGVTASPKFYNDFVLTASQEVNGTSDGTEVDGTVTQPDSGDCSQGLSITSNFEFSVVAQKDNDKQGMFIE